MKSKKIFFQIKSPSAFYNWGNLLLFFNFIYFIITKKIARKLMNVKILFSFFIITLLYACEKENSCDCIKGTGKIIIENRALNNFDKVYLEDNINVFITQDTIFELKVEAGENIVPLILTNVIDGTLYIKNKNRCNWSRSYKKPLNIFIKMPVIKYLTSDGTGKIKSLNTITSDVFDLQTKNSGDIELIVNNLKIVSHMHGSGDIILSGNTGEHACDIGGTAFLKCEALTTNYTWVHSFTTGICTVRASDLLICSIDQIGDIYCFGNPITVQEIKRGAGKLYLK